MAARRRARSTARAAAVPLARHERIPLPSRASVLTGLALFAAAAGAFAIARETPLFAVGEVQVHGGSPGVRRQVERALARETGVSLLKIDAGVVDRRLAGVSWVAAASFDRAFPHTLVVTVRPERPVAVLRRGAHSWLLSARGRVLQELRRGTHPGLPRIWVDASAAPPSAGTVLPDERGGRAARALAPLASVHFPARVASVRSGAGELTLVLRSGVQLRLGDPSDLRLKLAVARRVLPQLGPPDPRAYVDVSVPERAVAFNPQVAG